MYKNIIKKRLNLLESSKLRSVKVTYDNGDVVHTNMAADLTDDEIRDYFKIGKTFNIGDGPNDKMVKVKDVEILDKQVSENKVPGVSVTQKAQNKAKEQNNSAYDELTKKYKEYENSLKQDEEEFEPVKRNHTDSEAEYHDDAEIMNGMESLRYDGEVNDKFRDRQEMAIQGDPKMGNDIKTGEWDPETGEGNGNTEPMWGASDAEFGKKLIDKIRRSAKKKDDATQALHQFGDDIEKAAGDPKITRRNIAVESISKKIKNVMNENVDEANNSKSYNKIISSNEIINNFSDTIEKLISDVQEKYDINRKEACIALDYVFKKNEKLKPVQEKWDKYKSKIDENISMPKYKKGESIDLKNGNTKKIKKVTGYSPSKGVNTYIYTLEDGTKVKEADIE